MHPALYYAAMDDVTLAAHAAARDAQALRLIMSRNNQRLYRTAWGVLRNRADAEEAVQDAYVKAFSSRSFDGAAALSTWLTRVVLNEALSRKRAAQRRKRSLSGADVTQLDDYRETLMSKHAASPEFQVIHSELAKALEAAIARLPDDFRLVLVLRDIEGLSVEETSAALGAPAATIKTRHLRARRRLQRELDPDFRVALAETLRFAGSECEAMSMRVLAALAAGEEKP